MDPVIAGQRATVNRTISVYSSLSLFDKTAFDCTSGLFLILSFFTFLSNEPTSIFSVYQDSVFELISICQEMAIWLMKHASALTANPNPNEDEAKAVFKSLRKASGLFKFAQVNYFGRLQNQPVKGSDLDPRVSNAYHLQCLAEAQEGKRLRDHLECFWLI